MTTYVYSTRARQAHIGDATGTRCSKFPRAPFQVTDTVPDGYEVCPRCAAREAGHARAVARAHERARLAARDTLIVSLLAEGITDEVAARRMELGLRTFNRHANAAMRRAGARSRFQWGFNEGARMASARRP